MSFANASTESLMIVRDNLARGLDAVASHVKNGTFHKVPDTKGACPPSQSGQLTLALFKGVEAELASRKQ